MSTEGPRREQFRPRTRACWNKSVSDNHLPSTTDDDGESPEVKLELTRAGIQQVLALYAQEHEEPPAGGAFSVSFDDLQQVFAERRTMLLIGTLVGIALASLVLLFSTPLFPVSAQVVVERQDVSTSRPISGPGRGGSAFVATQAEIMQSRSVLAGAVDSLARPSYLDAEDDAISSAMETVVASPVSGTQVVALGYLGPDAQYGVDLLNSVVDSYRNSLQVIESENQSQKIEAKQSEVDALRDEALAIEKKLETMRAEKGIVGSAEDAVAAQAVVLEGLNQQLADARSQRITLQNRLAAGGQQLAILDPATRSLQEQLWQAEAELARAKLTLMPKHPSVQAAQRDVDVLTKQLRSSSKATPGALRRDVKSFAGLEKQLKSVYAEESSRMVELETYRRSENIFVLELERIREIADAQQRELLDQRLLGRLAASGEVGIGVLMIEEPRLPEGPAWPKPRFVLAVGLLFGLIGGFVAAIVSLRRVEDKIWTTAEVEYS